MRPALTTPTVEELAVLAAGTARLMVGDPVAATSRQRSLSGASVAALLA